MNDESHPPTAPRWRLLLAPLLLVVAAVFYYGSYLRFWFNPHDEGGTAAFTAMRLLAGEAPIRDIELGYNVGWFWPIVGLFKAFGANFILMRGYFFALSTLCAIWGWLVVWKVTRREWLAFLVGLALVVFPGSQFKNYIPMLCVLNTLAIVAAALWAGTSAPPFWRRALLGGFVLGLTLLIRVDLGYLFLLLWAGTILLRCFDVRTPARGRIVDALASIAVIGAMIFITHVPVYAIARAGGYSGQFLQQYESWAEFMGGQAGAMVQAQPSVTPEAVAEAAAKKTRKGSAPDRTTLPRVTWETFATFKTDKSALFVLTYLPPFIYALLVAWAGFTVIGALLRRTFTLDHPAMLALLLLGGSLATFPQFFFFRPDRPHLAEFMPGFIVATTSVLCLIVGRWRWLVTGLLSVQLGLFAWFALDHYSAGTIAARTKIKKKKREFFQGANGVGVWVHTDEKHELETVRRAVEEHSKPGDWLICYPYQPGYNVMTDRPSYERELYQDNATAPAGWGKGAIARIQENSPPVIIIDDRAINQVESSRFSRWARRVYEHIQANYELCAKVETIEVYRRKSTAAAIPLGESTPAPVAPIVPVAEPPALNP